MKTAFRKRILAMIAGLTALIITLGNGCSPGESNSQNVSSSNLDQVLNDLSHSGGNGRTYDGKLVQFEGRNKILCDSQMISDVTVSSDLLSGVLFIEKRFPKSNGICEIQKNEDRGEVDLFQSSNLATLEGKLLDKKLSVEDLYLDNQRTQIVCKSKFSPLLLLDSQWSGAVVMETDNPLIWNSRLDFVSRGPKTDFIIQNPPSGQLVQTEQKLEFRTISSVIQFKPGVFQMMYIAIDRPKIDALSPSASFGKRIYPGQMQYFYYDRNKEPVESISIAPFESICFVNEISSSRLVWRASSQYDFIQELLRALGN